MKLNVIIITASLASLLIQGSCQSYNNKPKTNTTMETTTANQATVIHITAESFKKNVFNYEVNKDWKFEGDKPCIIDFYADWCGPCKMVAPVLDQLAQEYAGKINIYKVNTETERELAQVFGITSIPTILFVPMNGQPQAAMGALPKDSFKKIITDVLKVQ